VGWSLSDSGSLDVGELTEVVATTAGGIGLGSTIGDLIEEYPNTEFYLYEDEVVEFSIPGWREPAGSVRSDRTPYVSGVIPFELLDPSWAVKRIQAGMRPESTRC